MADRALPVGYNLEACGGDPQFNQRRQLFRRSWRQGILTLSVAQLQLPSATFHFSPPVKNVATMDADALRKTVPGARIESVRLTRIALRQYAENRDLFFNCKSVIERNAIHFVSGLLNLLTQFRSRRA
jgi:hypothetical protein